MISLIRQLKLILNQMIGQQFQNKQIIIKKQNYPMNEYQPMSHQPSQMLNYNHNFNQKSNGQISHEKYQYNYNVENNRYIASVQASLQNPEILGESQLRQINNEMYALEKDIVQNNKELKLLNNKITKSDFQQAQIKKLFQKQQKLKVKRLQYQQILRNHEYLKQQMLQNKLKQNQIKHTLGREYQDVVSERKRLQKQQKQRQKQQESAMITYNQQAIMYERDRKKDHFEQQKRQAQQELRQRQYARQLERQQKEKQKQQYNQVLNYKNQLQTQKDHVYKQYYNHFMQEQQKLQNIYKNRAMEAEVSKQKQRQVHEQKQYETFQMRMMRQNQLKLRKITEERQSLKTFLQTQMEDNNKRKFRQRQDQLRYQNQTKSYQVNLSSYELMEKQKKKELQKKYDNELSIQIQNKNRLNQHNLQEAYRSSSLGNSQRLDGQISERKTHNPVTNPIDFKIGITNPYLIKEYENTKEKYMGDHNLKLRNLAMIGNNSLMNGQR